MEEIVSEVHIRFGNLHLFKVSFQACIFSFFLYSLIIFFSFLIRCCLRDDVIAEVHIRFRICLYFGRVLMIFFDFFELN